MYNLYQKLLKVQSEVPYLKKNATVTGYKAITHDYVTASVRDHFIKNNILVKTSVISHSSKQIKVLVKGQEKTNYIAEVHIRVELINADNPEERESVDSFGMSMDSQDKATGKAISYAVKYAFLKLLMIETGENDEERIVGTIIGECEYGESDARSESEKDFKSIEYRFVHIPTVRRHQIIDVIENIESIKKSLQNKTNKIHTLAKYSKITEERAEVDLLRDILSNPENYRERFEQKVNEDMDKITRG